jgi:guanylate kinase
MHSPGIQLVSITGPSGSGKTTLREEIIRALPYAYPVESYTTRAPRPEDPPGEYNHVSLREFSEMCGMNWFLWATPEYAGSRYGTTADAVKNVFEHEGTLGIMVLLPEVLQMLTQFLEKIGKSSQYLPIFIVPPDRVELGRRLRARGDSEESIQKRLNVDAGWLRDARNSKIPYTYICNDGTVKDMTTELLSLLSIP